MSNGKRSLGWGGGNNKVLPGGGDEEYDETAIVVATAIPIEGNYNYDDGIEKKMKVQKQTIAKEDVVDEEEVQKPLPSQARRNSTQQTAGAAGGTGKRKASTVMKPGQEPALTSTTFEAIKPWPSALKKQVVAALKLKANDAAGREFLTRHQWPSGLRDVLIRSVKKIPLRFFIVDDSGSMILNDGRRLATSGSNAR